MALLARAVAQVAGPQGTFLAEDYSPAEYTAPFVPEAWEPAAVSHCLKET